VADAPVRGGYAQALVGVTMADGPFAQGRIGYRPFDVLDIHATAEWNRRNPWAGVGLEYRF
jgi:hypothetical protein